MVFISIARFKMHAQSKQTGRVFIVKIIFVRNGDLINKLLNIDRLYEILQRIYTCDYFDV